VADRGLPDAYLHWISYVDADTRERLLGHPAPAARDAYASAWRATSGGTLDRLLDLNLRTYLLDDLLVKADRMSMAHGLEVRSPFLDVALAEYAIQLPPAYKARGLALKRVLKRAVSGDLPPEILRRRKRGFGVPLDRWFRTDLESYLADTLGSPAARVREYLRGDEVDALLAAHRSGRANRGGALWTLLTLEIFLRREGW
jgi:asparagine synthase (glutamine-hydrolysing)